MALKNEVKQVVRRGGAAALAAAFGVLAGCQAPDSQTSQTPDNNQTTAQQTVG